MVNKSSDIKVSYNLTFFILSKQISIPYLKNVLETELDNIKMEMNSSNEDNSHQDDSHAYVRINLVT